jgi:hypothetical protein
MQLLCLACLFMRKKADHTIWYPEDGLGKTRRHRVNVRIHNATGAALEILWPSCAARAFLWIQRRACWLLGSREFQASLSLTVWGRGMLIAVRGLRSVTKNSVNPSQILVLALDFHTWPKHDIVIEKKKQWTTRSNLRNWYIDCL